MPEANPLPLRVGVLGHVGHAEANELYGPAKRFDRLFHALYDQSLYAFGFEHPHATLFRADAPAVAETSRAQDTWTHFLWAPLPAAIAENADTYLLHAGVAVHARMMETAAMAGCHSYSLHPPAKAECPLDVFQQQMGMLADAQPPGLDLHILSPLAPEQHLSDPDHLRDFCRGTRFTPAIHAGNVFAATQLDPGPDGWRHILRDLPQPSVFCYNAQEFLHGKWKGITSYRGEFYSTPRLVPFLDAIRQRGCADDCLLVQGVHTDIEAREAFRVMARSAGLDPAKLARQPRARLAVDRDRIDPD